MFQATSYFLRGASKNELLMNRGIKKRFPEFTNEEFGKRTLTPSSLKKRSSNREKLQKTSFLRIDFVETQFL